MRPPSPTLPSELLLEYLARLKRPKAMLSGVRLVEPISQGDYDGLCGLYCIINAIRLVLAPYKELRDSEVRSLFWTGIRHIDREASLSAAVRKSVNQRLWPGLAERIGARAQSLAQIPILLEQPFTGRAAIEPHECLPALERMILAKQAPMVFMRGKYRHYSVICGYTPKSLQLFDSYGYQCVRRASCVTVTSASALHRFHFASLIAVSAKP